MRYRKLHKLGSAIYVIALFSSSLVFGNSALANTDLPSIVHGHARIQVLSPDVIRLEYSPRGRFTDNPSISIENRTLTAARYHVSESNGYLDVSTDKLSVKYKMGSGPFSATNLTIEWRDENGEHDWKPGDKDEQNLGGIPGDIALRATPGQETGPLSRNGYYLLDDSHSAVWDSSAKWVRPRENADGQDWYFFVYGRDFKSLFANLSQLSGAVPMIPRYMLGTWFGSRAGYSADEWKRIINRFHEERIPLDVLVLDSDSTAKYIWGGYDWDLEQMPDPPGFFKYAKDQGVKVTVNEHFQPLTSSDSSYFDHIRSAMNLPPGTKEIAHDLANEKYADLYMNVLHKPALDDGMAFWWEDGNASSSMPGLDATLWTRYIEFTGMERITGKRGFVFCRLGTPPWDEYPKIPTAPVWGSHRYGAFFSGDLFPHWSTLELLVPFNVQAGNMLVPYVNNLTAGVYELTVDSELYQRWVQFSAFSPLFWWHGIWGLRLPWEYGQPGLETARRFLQLRYSLVPYLYTYSRIAHETGEPIVRGTYIEYPNQDLAYRFKQQYLLGKELLVAPITSPGFGKPVNREIFLPKGDDWFDFFTGKVYQGGQVISYNCPLDRMPLFVKAGSILPRAPAMEFTDQRPVDPLTIEVFAGKAASFRLYEDDGNSLGYKKQAFAWTTLSYAPAEKSGQHTITVSPVEGHYQGQPVTRRIRILVHGLLKPSAVKVDGTVLNEKDPQTATGGWVWNVSEDILNIELPASLPVDKKIAIELEDAGSFADHVTAQEIADIRERVRRVEIDQKMKWGLLLRHQDIKKQPRVLRQIELVEDQLDDLLANPQGLSTRALDVQALFKKITTSFTDQPFESDRAIPEVDPDARKATLSIERASFTTDEIHKMNAELLGCALASHATGDRSPLVRARLDCDWKNISSPKITYSIALPDEGLPGWGEVNRSEDSEGYMEFELRAPYPCPPGPHEIRLRAILKWDGGETEVTQDVQWYSSGRAK